MERVAKFEKVSFKQFTDSLIQSFKDKYDVAESYAKVSIPKRATTGSAGYDIISPIDFTLKPGESIKVPTGIRIKMQSGWVLLIAPKSGLGSKYRLQLDNTLGVIDSDYYNADNEGHIFIPITNDSKSGKVLELKAGKAFAQAIIVPFGITEDDETSGTRTGGFGSTGV